MWWSPTPVILLPRDAGTIAVQGAHRRRTPPTLTPLKCVRRSSIRACLPREFMGLSRSGVERRPRRRVEVCAIAICVYVRVFYFVIIISIVMIIIIFLGRCVSFLVIKPCNYFSKFEPSGRLTDPSCCFLNPRTRTGKCLYNPP